MPLYIYQAAYTAESVAAQIREPADRFEAVRPAFEAMGGKIVVGGYPFGEYDMLVVIEAPADTTAAGFGLDHHPRKTSPMSFPPIFRLGGSFAEIADDATAFGGRRSTRYV